MAGRLDFTRAVGSGSSAQVDDFILFDYGFNIMLCDRRKKAERSVRSRQWIGHMSRGG